MLRSIGKAEPPRAMSPRKVAHSARLRRNDLQQYGDLDAATIDEEPTARVLGACSLS